MNHKKQTYSAILVLFIISLVLLLVSWTGGSRTYEIQPDVQVGVEGYRSDVARIVDAYERLMDRYISMVDKDMSRAVLTLDAMEHRMAVIDARLERIEKALDITAPLPLEQAKPGQMPQK